MSITKNLIVNNYSFTRETISESLCRICLENGATIPLFESNEEEKCDIESKLSMCLKEKIEDIEGYPRFICNICNNIIDSAYNLINKYRETAKILENGVELIKQESELVKDHFEEVENIKTELDDHLSNDGDFSDNDKEYLEPLLKIKAKNVSIKKIRPSTTNNRQVTNKIASSILEGQFAWNGDEWCLKTSKTKKQTAGEKIKLSQRIKSKNRQRVKIEIPKIKKPNPPKLCDLCGEVFKDQDKLSVHKRKVHFPTSKTCPHCKKILSSTYYLNRHIKRKHSEKKEFICSVCGREFAFKAELKSHNRNVHEKHLRPKKQYKCKFCQKVYKCPKSVIVHERSAHTGQRPAICNVCDSSFYHVDYLKEHMRLHTGETPFKCPICGRGYAQRCNMKSHLRIHKVSELDANTLSKLRPNYLRLLKA